MNYVFQYLSRPTDGNHNFPFHIRTTQVDIDIGFDPQTAYVCSGNWFETKRKIYFQAENNGNNINDGMHGVMELAVTSGDDPEKDSGSDEVIEDRGVLERPQITTS